MSHWETLDVEALLNRRDESTGSGAVGGGGGTTSANAGAYQVPLGAPLRRKIPGAQYTTIDAPKRTGNDPEMEWALGMVK